MATKKPRIPGGPPVGLPRDPLNRNAKATFGAAHASAHGFPPGHPLHAKMAQAHSVYGNSDADEKHESASLHAIKKQAGAIINHPNAPQEARDLASKALAHAANDRLHQAVMHLGAAQSKMGASTGLQGRMGSSDRAAEHAAAQSMGLTDKMHSDHTSPRDAKLESIAKKHLGLSTLKTQNSDERDFHEHASWQVHSALQAAYHAGRGTEGSTNPDHQAAAKRAGEAAAPHVPSTPANSSADFKEHSVWGMKEALGHAYDIGERAKKVGFDREPQKGSHIFSVASEASGKAGHASVHANSESGTSAYGHTMASDAHGDAANAHLAARDAHLKAARASTGETARMHLVQAEHHTSEAAKHTTKQREHTEAAVQTGKRGGTYTVGPGGSKHYIK